MYNKMIQVLEQQSVKYDQAPCTVALEFIHKGRYEDYLPCEFNSCEFQSCNPDYFILFQWMHIVSFSMMKNVTIFMLSMLW